MDSKYLSRIRECFPALVIDSVEWNIVTGGALDTNIFKDTSILRELGYKSRQLSATNQQTEHRDSTSFRSQGHSAVPISGL